MFSLINPGILFVIFTLFPDTQIVQTDELLSLDALIVTNDPDTALLNLFLASLTFRHEAFDEKLNRLESICCFKAKCHKYAGEYFL
jgi:hypothetical protein